MDIKQLPVTSPKLEKAETIEDILCLATLIANGELPPNASLEDSASFLEFEAGCCGNCPFNLTCLACISNE